MAEKILQTRLQLKYDTLNNWNTNDPVLKSGEVAIVTVPNKVDPVTQAPAVLMKVGDGSKKFSELKFVSGLAANVHDWALAAVKPSYTAEEIGGLADYINGEVQDTDTQYTVVKVEGNNYQYKLMSKAKGATEFTTEVAVIDIPKYDDTEVKADIEALEGLVGTTSVQAQIAAYVEGLKLAETYDAKGAAAQALVDAKAYADGKDAAIQAAKDAADAAQGDVDALAGKVGEVAEGKTVVGMLTEAISGVESTHATDKAALEQSIGANASAIEALQGTHATDKAALEQSIGANASAIEELQGLVGENKGDLEEAIQANADAISELAGTHATDKAALEQAIGQNASAIELLTNGVKADEVDGVNDLIQYVKEHGTEVTGIKADIKANADAIAALEGTHGTDKAALEAAIGANASAIEALQGTHATDKAALEGSIQTNANDIDALEGRMGTAEGKIATLEGVSHDHDNKDVLDGISAEKVTAWEDAATKAHVHANKAELDLIQSGDVAKWNAAEQNAKDYADSLAGNYDAAGAADAALEAAKGYADGKDAAIQAAQAAADKAQGEVDALELEVAKKANDADLHAIAKSGNVNDLVQTTGDVLVFQCGDSTGM